MHEDILMFILLTPFLVAVGCFYFFGFWIGVVAWLVAILLFIIIGGIIDSSEGR